jgi:hypothetical protein
MLPHLRHQGQIMTSISNGKKGKLYLIRIQEKLDTHWADWFTGFKIRLTGNNQTELVGQVTDQSALHGLLGKIRDLGLTLLSVQIIDSKADMEESSHDVRA